MEAHPETTDAWHRAAEIRKAGRTNMFIGMDSASQQIDREQLHEQNLVNLDLLNRRQGLHAAGIISEL